MDITHYRDLVGKVFGQNFVGLVLLKLQVPPQQNVHADFLRFCLEGEQTACLSIKSIPDLLLKFFLRNIEWVAQQDILHDSPQDGRLNDA